MSNRRPNIALSLLLIMVLFAGGGDQDRPIYDHKGPKARPSDWMMTQRLYPYWRADADVYTEAARTARKLPKGSNRYEIPPWTLLGPTDVAGRIVDLAFNPRNPDTVYAAAATGGVFLSSDAGLTWHAIFDDQPSLSIGDLAVDPSDPSVVYVGTGEANGGHNNLPGAGLFKSTDGGASWTASGLTNSVSIARIVVDPDDSRRVFAAVVGSYFAPGAERGLYRSLDGGESWDQVFAPGESVGVIDLVMHPNHPDTLYAATWDRVRSYEEIALSGPGSGVYRSYDGGETWERLGSATGFPEGPNIGRIGLSLCDSQPEVIYASVNDGYRYLGIYKTVDGGDEWIDADPLGQARSTTNFSWYFGQIRVSPSDPDEVYFLDVQLVRSRNGGGNWSHVSTGLHVDYHALEFVPGDPDRILLGNDGGIGVSADNGETWRAVTQLPITQFYEVAVDQSNPGRVFGGTQDQGTIRRDPDTGVWDMALGGDGFEPLIHPLDPFTVYMQSQNGRLVKSFDGGNSTFQVATAERGVNPADPRNWSTPVTMDPSNPDVLYYGTDRVYRTDNGGLNWDAISPKLPLRSLSSPLLGTVTAIAVAPSDPSIVYAGTDDGRVWITVDPKAEWVDQTRDLPERWVTDIAVDPSDPFTAYVTFSGLKWKDPASHLFKTVEAGESWVDVGSALPDAPLNAVAIDPADPSLVFAGSDIGVFVSEDAGMSWRMLDAGMPAAAVYDLDIQADARKLVASTHGRSIFETALPALQVAIDEETVPPVAYAKLETWPNPFSGRLFMQVSRGGQSDAKDLAPGRDYGTAFEIFDMRGRLVRRLVVEGGFAQWDGRAATGIQAPAGRYVVRARSGSNAASAQTVILLRND